MVEAPGGGAGAFDLTAAARLLPLGATPTRERAAAGSIVLHLVVLGPALLLGLYYFLRSDVSLARLRRLASDGEAGQEESESDGNPRAADRQAAVKKNVNRQSSIVNSKA